MSFATCDHLKEDGVYCDSPALRGQSFCYFHLNVRARRMQAAQARRRGEICRIHLPVLEDMHAVQASLMQVLDALADDRIDHKRAGLMLYGLQLASTSLIGTPGWKGKRQQVACAEPLRAIEAPDVAAQYDLPKNVDLDLPPEAALEAAEQPADASEKPTEHRRLARVPLPEASDGESVRDKYFIIPKEPGKEITFDELSYQLSRMESLCGDTRQPDARSRAAGLSLDEDGFVQQSGLPGGPQLPSFGNCREEEDAA
jgi:hypothetical protein